MQIVLTILILAAAVGYAARRIYKTLTGEDDPCQGCQGCALKKKSGEKFGCSEK